MKDNLRSLPWVVGAVVVVAFAFSGEAPLNSQGRGGANNPVPDMTGEWAISGSGYLFDDVTDPDPDPATNGPIFFQADFGLFMDVTVQTGRVFAGTFDPGGGEEPNRITGAVLPDGTVSIQFFENTELRGFFTGSMGAGGSTDITGYFHMFDDFGFGVDTTMLSGVFELVKVP